MAAQASPLSQKGLGLEGVPLIYTSGRLSSYQGKTVIQLVIDISSIAAIKASGAALSSFVAGAAFQAALIGFKVLVLKDTSLVWNEGAKIVAEKAAKEIGKEVVIRTALEVSKEIVVTGVGVAVVPTFVTGIGAAYDATKYEYAFYIDPQELSAFSNLLKKCKVIIQAFIDDPQFIEPNGAAELTDPISQEAMIYPVRTPCGHYFEASEIDRWLSSSQTCPLDRKPINGAQDLKFSWEVHVKIVKVIRGIVHRMQQNPNVLPPDLTNEDLTHLNQDLANLYNYSVSQTNMIHMHVIEALRSARNNQQLSEDHYDQFAGLLREWKNKF